MIKVDYEIYHNDYRRSDKVITFGSLDELKDWLFGQMKRPYNDSYAMYFPNPNRADAEPSSIEIHPDFGEPTILIHQIENENGIIFSDGRHTSGQKHWNNQIKEWLVLCNNFKKAPQFKFA